MKYRLEIDGLRAVAVLPVIFFMLALVFFAAGTLVLTFFLSSAATLSPA